jgi:hypothetical protein
MHNNHNIFNQRNQMLNRVSEVSQSQEDRASERGFRSDQPNGKLGIQYSLRLSLGMVYQKHNILSSVLTSSPPY